VTQPSRSTLFRDGVHTVLASSDFRAHGSDFDRRHLIKRANSVGGPSLRMRLLHWRTLAELGRIPRSDEGYAVEAISGINTYGAGKVEIFMMSHRWLRPSRDPLLSHPDSPDGQKARAINEFSLWRRKWVQDRHGFLPEVYYWIDFSCMDQEDNEDAVTMLPLWTACCERFLRFETEDYDERTWCRVEPLLSYVFSFADHHVSIGLDFTCRWPYFGKETMRPILDPRGGKLTNPSDMALIHPLIDISTRSRPSDPTRNEVCMNKTKFKCYML
jgi:hypothetical protein